MNGLDLFSGIGGITRALAGYVSPIAYCENDRYAQAVLLSRMAARDIPRAPIWDDVRTLRSEMLPRVEIVYGGFPCQDISVAGRGAGLGGKRSGLFYEIARLVGELRPRFVFLENVPAIRRRGGSVVVGGLASLGYDCRWTTLSAAAVGANHIRQRWWLLAYAARGQNVERGPGGVGEEAAGRESIDAPSRDGGADVADTHGAGFGKRRRAEPNEKKLHPAEYVRENVRDPNLLRGQGDNVGQPLGLTERCWWATEPNVGRVANGVPQRVDRLRALGNAVVPAQAREAFERLMGLK